MKKPTLSFIAAALVILLCSCTGEYYFRRAMKCETEGDFKKAIEYLDIVIKKDSKNYKAYINRGADKSELRDFVGAIDDYTTAISIDSTKLVAYMNRAANLIRIEDYSGALADYQEALLRSDFDTNPSDKITISMTGLRLPDFLTRYSSEPEQNDAIYYSLCDILSERGVAYYNMDSLSLAVKDFNFCIANGHDLGFNYYWRGFCFLNAGNISQGCNDLKKSYIHGNMYAEEEMKKYCNCGNE